MKAVLSCRTYVYEVLSILSRAAPISIPGFTRKIASDTRHQYLCILTNLNMSAVLNLLSICQQNYWQLKKKIKMVKCFEEMPNYAENNNCI